MTDQLSAAFALWLTFLSSVGVEMRPFLNPPATIEQIREVEQKIAYRLPDDLTELYLIADGQVNTIGLTDPTPGKYFAALFGGYGFVSLEDAYQDWVSRSYIAKNYPEFDEVVTVKEGHPVDRKNFQPSWFPFSYDGSGNAWAVDLDPPDGGTVGQVIVIGRDESERRVIASSLTELFAMAATKLNRENLYVLSGVANHIQFEMDWNRPPATSEPIEPEMDPQTKALGEHYKSMLAWVGEHHPRALQSLETQLGSHFMLMFHGEQGIYAQTEYKHPLMVATSLEAASRGQLGIGELNQALESWRLIHLWLKEEGLIGVDRYADVEAIRLNTDRARDDILRTYRVRMAPTGKGYSWEIPDDSDR